MIGKNMTPTEIDKTLIKLLLVATKDKRFTENTFSDFNGGYDEKEKMIKYLEEHPSANKTDITAASMEIILPRWNKENKVANERN